MQSAERACGNWHDILMNINGCPLQGLSVTGLLCQATFWRAFMTPMLARHEGMCAVLPGEFPSSWSQLSALKQLDASVNHINASFPSTFGSNGAWPHLETLNIASNRIAGNEVLVGSQKQSSILMRLLTTDQVCM